MRRDDEFPLSVLCRGLSRAIRDYATHKGGRHARQPRHGWCMILYPPLRGPRPWSAAEAHWEGGAGI